MRKLKRALALGVLATATVRIDGRFDLVDDEWDYDETEWEYFPTKYVTVTKDTTQSMVSTLRWNRARSLAC